MRLSFVAAGCFTLAACHGDAPHKAGAAASASAKRVHDVASAAPSHAPPPRPPLAPPPTGPATLTTSGKSATLSAQVAYLGEDGVLTVVLADRPYACDELGAKMVDDTKRRSITLTIPPGPNASYFAGGRIGVAGQIEGVAGASYLEPSELTAEIAAADTKTGGHVTGWTTWQRSDSSVSGAFDAKVCPPLYTTPAPKLDASAPTAPIAGSMAGEGFAAKKVLAIVRHSKKLGLDYVSEIDAFASPDVACADLPLSDKQTPSLAITDIGGVSSKEDYSGTTQPMVGMYAASGWKVGKPRATGRGWIRLESLDFVGPLVGTMRLANASGSIGGAFTAEVCKK